LPAVRPTSLPRDNHRPVELASCVSPTPRLLPNRIEPPHAPKGDPRHLASWFQPGRPRAGTGISTRYPSATTVGLVLGPEFPDSLRNRGHSRSTKFCVN
jgi:hypothetical protein